MGPHLRFGVAIKGEAEPSSLNFTADRREALRATQGSEDHSALVLFFCSCRTFALRALGSWVAHFVRDWFSRFAREGGSSLRSETRGCAGGRARTRPEICRRPVKTISRLKKAAGFGRRELNGKNRSSTANFGENREFRGKSRISFAFFPIFGEIRSPRIIFGARRGNSCDFRRISGRRAQRHDVFLLPTSSPANRSPHCDASFFWSSLWSEGPSAVKSLRDDAIFYIHRSGPIVVFDEEPKCSTIVRIELCGDSPIRVRALL